MKIATTSKMKMIMLTIRLARRTNIARPTRTMMAPTTGHLFTQSLPTSQYLDLCGVSQAVDASPRTFRGAEPG